MDSRPATAATALLAAMALALCGCGPESPTTTQTTTTTTTATTTTTTTFAVESPCVADGKIADCVQYLNEQYTGYDPDKPGSPLGVVIRGQPRFGEWVFCTGKCYQGHADCYVAGSMLNSKVMLKASGSLAMPMNYAVGIVFQPMAIQKHLAKCSWQFDGSAFNRLNGGCGCGGAGDCKSSASAFSNVCPSTKKPATGGCPEVDRCSCDVRETNYPGTCFWKGPAFMSSPTKGEDVNLTAGVDETPMMLKQRTESVKNNPNGRTGDGIPLMQYWNEVTIDGNILVFMLRNNAPAAVAAFMYQKGSKQARGWAEQFNEKLSKDYGHKVPIVAMDYGMDVTKGTGPFSAPEELLVV